MTTPPPSDVVPSPPTDASPTIPRSRTSSFSDSLINARPHLGALAATGHIFGSAPSIKDLRRNSANGSIGMAGMGRRGSSLSAFTVAEKSPPILEDEHEAAPLSAQVAGAEDGDEDEKEKEKPGAWAVTVEGLRAFWGFFTKPFGFFITIYMLNGRHSRFIFEGVLLTFGSGGMGRNALPPTLQRFTSYVQADLQRPLFPPPDLD